MTHRETTIEAYEKVKASGILSDLRLKVFEIVCLHGPITASELRMRISSSANSGVFGTRLSELEKMGVIKTVDTRKCTVSNHRALVWEVTGQLPVKLKKPKTQKQKIKDLQYLIVKLGKDVEDKWKPHLRLIYQKSKEL